jgi:hypothetical protein
MERCPLNGKKGEDVEAMPADSVQVVLLLAIDTFPRSAFSVYFFPTHGKRGYTSSSQVMDNDAPHPQNVTPE